MIRYRKQSLQTLFYWWGGIHRHLLRAGLLYLCFLVPVFALMALGWRPPEHSRPALDMLGSMTIFFLVFRLNQATLRNLEAVHRIDHLLSRLSELVRVTCICLTGASQDSITSVVFPPQKTLSDSEIASLRVYHELASATRIHVVRLSLAFAVGFLLHCQLSAAMYESDGELDDESLLHVVFLYSRLQSLLYREEMEVVDQCVCVSCEMRDGIYTYRAEVGRFRVRGGFGMTLVLPEDGRGPATGIVPTLPMLLMAMLSDVCYQPLSQHWGYPERLLGLVQSTATDVMDDVVHLAGLISRPVSLAYYQHCQVLVLCFVVLSPIFFEQDSEVSWIDSVVVPFFTFWAMIGLARLAETMENPLGNDDTDINLMQQIHRLEVNVQLSFEMAEAHRCKMKQALVRGLTFLPDDCQTPLSSETQFLPKNFDDYFCWLPIPTVVTEDMILKHGHAETTHAAFYQGYIFNFRSFIRKSLRRNSFGMRQESQSTVQEIRLDRLTRFRQANTESPDQQLQTDPTVFCHYIAFRGVLSQNSKELHHQAAWKERAMSLLKGHDAAKLVCQEDGDSARSVVLQPLAEKHSPEKRPSELSHMATHGQDEVEHSKTPLLSPPPRSITAASKFQANPTSSSPESVEARREYHVAHSAATGSEFYIGSPFVSVSTSLAAAEARVLQSPELKQRP